MGEPRRLEPATVVAEAVRVLDEHGLDAVTLRAVADRLGVRMNTVLWHVKSKARLRELMADALIGEIGFDDLPGPWEPRVRELFHRLRRVLLAHRDGAALVTGTYALEPHVLRFAEELATTLLRGGLAAREASWAVWTSLYVTLGLVQEEQAPSGPRPAALREAVDERRYPALHGILGEFTGTDFAARFDFAITAQLAALREHAQRPPSP
ncbi:TetR/AcrR family transcriptional regulator C-terminal domain-containing protein [Saccharopolyspora sp. NFXS83]|uniref:TetR/AcrR family transcriptional regulator C-terminal domain-containing protein n=1 Tax=Saccharopolyspora sp. NFXS83 TaxID=2993560 RepID=UPI00224AC92E|nr:TetR/AcrR family transcriptional regulator C-terminal domain-containing protein [Saccharopolyspora sp. NFXS83]MCX2733861.1 TetR/AcrR family transcriptional regulator C-terminal domain-containing protein [Saccharopolyspora sp. NFXS83]